jgi:hypothetical protein
MGLIALELDQGLQLALEHRLDADRVLVMVNRPGRRSGEDMQRAFVDVRRAFKAEIPRGVRHAPTQGRRQEQGAPDEA